MALARTSRPATRSLLALPSLLLASWATASAQLPVADWHGQAGGRFGAAVANAGDVDGDGTDDLIVGERMYDDVILTDCGRVCVYSGSTLTLIREHRGGQAREEFGTAVAAAGDVDLDGFADYAVGAPNYNDGSKIDSGRVVVFSGATGGVIWGTPGAAAIEKLGASLAGIADEDGDGRPELIVGLPNLAEARILDEAGNLGLTLTGAAGSDFGWAVARCGDLDGDGVDDFLVSAPSWDPSAAIANVGRVDLHSGADAAFLGSFQGDSDGDAFGWSIAGIADVDGDLVPDLLAGAVSADAAGIDAGYVRIVSGSSLATVSTHYGDAAGDAFGFAVAGAGDFDRDGIGDWAVGAISGGAAGLGLVRVFSGADGTVAWEFEGVADSQGSNTFLGQSLASGDFNGDAVGDLVLADHYFADAASALVGGVWVELGVPAWWANYGAGWPGKFGVPALAALDPPALGHALDVQLGNSLGASSVGLLFVGLADANLPTSAGGTLLVTPLFTLPLALPAAGLTLSSTLPTDPALAFLAVYVQALELDPFASNGISFTAGLELHLGFEFP